jgi:hypothetical protein
MFCFQVEITDLPLSLPQEHNSWIMLAFVDLGINDDKLIRLNQAQCYQHVLFKSDVFNASGWALDRQYLERWPAGKVWSTLLFPQEQPSAKDFQIWKTALHLLAPRGRPNHWMGRFIKKGHKIWEWYYNLEGFQLYHLKGTGMDVYTPPPGTAEARQPNQWTHIEMDLLRYDIGSICTVKDIRGVEKAVLCYADGSQLTPHPLTFWEVLHKWQHEWMWDNLQWIGDED